MWEPIKIKDLMVWRGAARSSRLQNQFLEVPMFFFKELFF
jgi:hypothetical protein